MKGRCWNFYIIKPLFLLPPKKTIRLCTQLHKLQFFCLFVSMKNIYCWERKQEKVSGTRLLISYICGVVFFSWTWNLALGEEMARIELEMTKPNERRCESLGKRSIFVHWDHVAKSVIQIKRGGFTTPSSSSYSNSSSIKPQ